MVQVVRPTLATLAAARHFARVVSTDHVPALLEKGRLRVAAEGLAVTFREADAEHLPFGNGDFDVVVSTFGVMFAPDHQRAAAEMLRVLRPGGRIGQLFKTIAAHVAPPPGLQSPPLWGIEAHLRALFGDQCERYQIARRVFNFRYASAAHWLQVFRDFYGPTNRDFAALAPDGQQALERHTLALLERFNTAGPASLLVPADYLEAVLTKRAVFM
ncbi:MAG: class I SAM-dependent methyltransferase [Pseudomonadota bacterium]